MYYEAVAADNKRSIGMAVSQDGVKDWRRLGRPVLEAGQPGSWDAGGVCSPSVVSMAGEHDESMRARNLGPEYTHLESKPPYHGGWHDPHTMSPHAGGVSGGDVSVYTAAILNSNL